MSRAYKIPEGQIVSTRQLAKLLGLSLAQMYKYYNEGMPVLKEGSRGIGAEIHVPSVFEWLVEKEVDRRMALRRNEMEITAGDKARLLRAQADHRELVVKKLESKLISHDIVGMVLREVFVRLRRSVMDLPGRKAAEFAQMSSAAQIKREQHDECVLTMEHCKQAVIGYCEELENEPEEDEGPERFSL